MCRRLTWTDSYTPYPSYSCRSPVHMIMVNFFLPALDRKLKGRCHKIFCFRFFYGSSSPKLLKITLGRFKFFSNTQGDIRKSRCTTGINGKFCYWYCWCRWYWWQICHQCQWYWRQIMGTISGCLHLIQTKQLKHFWLKIFPFGVNNTGGTPWAANISLNFLKIWNGPNGILRGFGKLINETNLKSKILWHCPFKRFWHFDDPVLYKGGYSKIYFLVS
jgi:hypothetical protein